MYCKPLLYYFCYVMLLFRLSIYFWRQLWLLAVSEVLFFCFHPLTVCSERWCDLECENVCRGIMCTIFKINQIFPISYDLIYLLCHIPCITQKEINLWCENQWVRIVESVVSDYSLTKKKVQLLNVRFHKLQFLFTLK